jgi:hypothetical protein
MSMRIDEDSIRFRIAPDELATLLETGKLDLRIAIGSRNFGYRIACGAPEMTLDVAPEGFTLAVPRSTLEQLQEMGRSKDGVSVRQGGIEVSLQVDLKRRV